MKIKFPGMTNHFIILKDTFSLLYVVDVIEFSDIFMQFIYRHSLFSWFNDIRAVGASVKLINVNYGLSPLENRWLSQQSLLWDYSLQVIHARHWRDHFYVMWHVPECCSHSFGIILFK